MIRGRKIKFNKKEPLSKIINVNIHNKFDIEVIDAKTGVIKQKVECYNTICDGLWNNLSMDRYGYAAYIHYGNGSGVPSPSDKTLFSRLGSKAVTNAGSEIDYINGIFTQKYKIQIPEDDTATLNNVITEVGIAKEYSAQLCTHAMLQDMNGNNISITKTETDIINIYATIYVHFNPSGYANSSIFLYYPKGNGQKVSILEKLAGVSNSNSLTNSFRYYSHGGGLSAKSDSSSYYSLSDASENNPADKTFSLVGTRLGSNSGNVGGITGISVTCSYYSYGSGNTYDRGIYIRPGYDNNLPASKIVGETVGTGDGTTKDYNLAFPHAENARVYINGVETTDFYIDYAPKDLSWEYDVWLILPESTPDKLIPDVIWGSTTKQFTFYNPYWRIGLSSITYSDGNVNVWCSNDLETWYGVTNYDSIESQYAHYKYWKILGNNDTTLYTYYLAITPATTFNGKTLHFNNPPAVDSIITIDYTSKSIAKDINHVFDLTIKFTLGEYTVTDDGGGGNADTGYTVRFEQSKVPGYTDSVSTTQDCAYSLNGGTTWNTCNTLPMMISNVKGSIKFRDWATGYEGTYIIGDTDSTIREIINYPKSNDVIIPIDKDTTLYVGRATGPGVNITLGDAYVDHWEHGTFECSYSVDSGVTWIPITSKNTTVTRPVSTIRFKYTALDGVDAPICKNLTSNKVWDWETEYTITNDIDIDINALPTVNVYLSNTIQSLVDAGTTRLDYSLDSGYSWTAIRYNDTIIKNIDKIRFRWSSTDLEPILWINDMGIVPWDTDFNLTENTTFSIEE